MDNALEDLKRQGKLRGLSLSQIRKLVLAELLPEEERMSEQLFMARFDRWTETEIKQGKKTYIQIAKKIRAFDARAEELHFEDITKDWLVEFDKWMAESAPSLNARSIMLRNIRTVFNDAIDNEITTWYPFRRFKIKAAPTKDRTLSAAHSASYSTTRVRLGSRSMWR